MQLVLQPKVGNLVSGGTMASSIKRTHANASVSYPELISKLARNSDFALRLVK